MNKLMIAAAMVCAAAFAQAACIDWSVANSAWKDASGNNPASGSLVYLINGDTALDTIAAAVKAGTVASQDWYYGSAATDNTKGRISENKVDAGSKLTIGQEYNFSALMVDGDKYMVSATAAQVAYKDGEEAMVVAFSSGLLGANAQTYNASTAANGWAATTAAPEPTSAMLLLLGVAGLALKRKRA